MTNRTDVNPKSPIEVATEEVLEHFSVAIGMTWHNRRLQISEQAFRRIVAGYLFNMTEPEIFRTCGTQHDPEHPV